MKPLRALLASLVLLLTTVVVGVAPAGPAAAASCVSPAVSSSADTTFSFPISIVSYTTPNTRAAWWDNDSLRYSQSCYAHQNLTLSSSRKYRTDCSGYVSMIWGLTASYDTYRFMHPKSSDEWKVVADDGDFTLAQIQPGDAVVWRTSTSQHIVYISSVLGSIGVVWEYDMTTDISPTGVRYAKKSLSWLTTGSHAGSSLLRLRALA